MSKILITSIGAGVYNKEGSKYNKAKYYTDNKKDCVETPYIFTALKHFYGVDKCVLLGTSGSSWYTLYEYVCKEYPKEANIPVLYDEKLSCSLKRLNNPQGIYTKDQEGEIFTGIYTEDQEKEIFKQLKKNLKPLCEDIVILNNGVNSKEINDNLRILISSLEKIVKDGDEIYFDITHSFRSLALYELVTVNYFKDALRKNITIEAVSYGMLEISRQNKGFTPIVDLSPITNIIEWTKAAEEYKRFGTACVLSELIRNKNLGIEISNKEKIALEGLGDLSSFDSIEGFRTLVEICARISKDENNSNLSKAENKIFGYIFKDIKKRFGDKINNETLFYLEIAKWHFDHNRYHLSAIVLAEGLLNYMASLFEIDRKSWSWNKDLNFRRCVGNAASNNKTVSKFLEDYKEMNDLRNKLCHFDPLSGTEKASLPKRIEKICQMINNDFKKDSENEKELKKALEIQMNKKEKDKAVIKL